LQKEKPPSEEFEEKVSNTSPDVHSMASSGFVSMHPSEALVSVCLDPVVWPRCCCPPGLQGGPGSSDEELVAMDDDEGEVKVHRGGEGGVWPVCTERLVYQAVSQGVGLTYCDLAHPAA
jgi:hypothetical protein